MNLKNFVWVGGLVNYNGLRATVLEIHPPKLTIILADGQREVRLEEVKPIGEDMVINVHHN